MRIEYPSNVSEQERRVIEEAVERYLGTSRTRPNPWTLAGREYVLRLGALQVRHQSAHAWADTTRTAFTRPGTESRMGRGDSK